MPKKIEIFVFKLFLLLNLSVGYTFKAPNMNYTKEFFDDIYSRVLIFGVEKKQGGLYDGQTHNILNIKLYLE